MKNKTALLIWNIIGFETQYFLIKNDDEIIKKLLGCHNKVINEQDLDDDDFVFSLIYLTEKPETTQEYPTPDEELTSLGLSQSDVGSFVKYRISDTDLLNINQHIDHVVIAGIN